MKIVFSLVFLFSSICFVSNGQCISGNCDNGLGEKIYPDKSRFVGKFQAGLKEEGIFIYPNGDLYKGQFYKNLRSGDGLYQFKNGNVFIGKYVEDNRYYGTLKFVNGDSYAGSWENNLPSGIGTYYYANGRKWEGQWENGKRVWGVHISDTTSGNITEQLNADSVIIEKFIEPSQKGVAMPKVYAIIIGISDYEGVINDLKYADDDARAFYSHLIKAMPRETEAGDVRILLNGEATEARVLQSIKEVFSKADENDFILFYFSGHGAQGYFCSADISSGKLSHSTIKSYFKSSKANYRLCIADACFSGSIGQSSGSSAANAANSMRDVRLAVIMSSRPNQTSSENGSLQQGLFTYYLNAGIRGAADFNQDSYITAAELFLYTRNRVSQQSRGDQVPVIFGQNLNRIPLSRIKR